MERVVATRVLSGSGSMVEPGESGNAELDLGTLVQAKAGEDRACRVLFRCYAERIHAYLWRMLGARATRSSIEDLTQETFLRVFKALRGFDSAGPARLSTWILTIAHRLALNELRRLARNKIEVVDEVQIASVHGELPPEPALNELGLRLQRALDDLTDDHRAVVLLHDLHGLTQDEVAAALEIPTGTVKSRLSRARGALRAALELEDE